MKPVPAVSSTVRPANHHESLQSMSLIRIRELTKQYPGVKALDALDLELEHGLIGLTGANGAGKSTLIRILLGMIPPTRGTAEVLGFDAHRDTFEVRRLVGYLPEHDCLPPDVSAAEFVHHMGRMSGLPVKAARERAAETLRHVGLYEERYRLMGGYSTGMKQRVKLAQALVHDPKLLLLDEPTNGLDPAGRDEMLGLVERTGREFGIAVIVTSHLLGEIERVCDWLVTIEEGRLRYAGPVASFTQRTRRLSIDVDDGIDTFAARLRERGLDIERTGPGIAVVVVDDACYDIIRDVAAELATPVARIELQRRSVDELFRDAPGLAGERHD
jgi:ABC-2 type transport system ATP-binding protein